MKYIINESQYVNLLENLEKNKRFLKNKLGIDFTDKIQQITSSYDFPMEFDQGVSPEMVRRYLNVFGPMYLFELDGKKYIYQDRGDYDFFMDEEGFDFVDNEIPEKLGIDIMGLRFSDIIDMYFNEEDDVITEKNGYLLEHNMKKIIKLTESDLTNIVRRVIEEDKESLEREARIILNGIGYSMTLLKNYTRKELAKTLRRENKDRSGGHDKWEKLADKLDN